MGRRTLQQRKGATKAELKYANWDVAAGMFFSNVGMYFIILATAATLFKTGKTDKQSAPEAAQGPRPPAGGGAQNFFAAGLLRAGLPGPPSPAGAAALPV